LVGKPEYKKPSGMTRLGLEYNIKMDLKYVGLLVVDWIDLAQVRVRDVLLWEAVMNDLFP